MRVDEVQAPQTEETTNPFGWGFACGAAVAMVACVALFVALFVFTLLPLYRSKADAVKVAAEIIHDLRWEAGNRRMEASQEPTLIYYSALANPVR